MTDWNRRAELYATLRTLAVRYGVPIYTAIQPRPAPMWLPVDVPIRFIGVDYVSFLTPK